ncbi:MAG: histidine phosphatase family protein [Alphaproteobacteria bacterium]|nr:histidine phosphatase family protein [Alphaproteobacteria bacterium]MDE2012449.1 histidine phosphatase family protein [Alphaproteobacteria bacterium]MDE2072087.1 histidine phosphatase family protein [Alphaproteobacteria bacterium]MDE2352789.1 histidine phosphatase family protein [Alphaproteobacteria bacterium]
MKRLILFRHAKAVQSSTQGDHGRGLNPRGQHDAAAMGREMAARGLVPELILISSARRTTETWRLAAPELKAAPDVQVSDALYLAPPRAILALLREQGGSAGTVMVIGHNPGLEEFAAELLGPAAGRSEEIRRGALDEKFPTAAFAVLDCDIAGWNQLKRGSATLADFLRPRDLD